MLSDDSTYDALLQFWFGSDLDSPEAVAEHSALWFAPSVAADREIAERFGALPDRAAAGELDGWRDSPLPALARVLVLDQLPRNLYRDDPQAFAYDELGLQAANDAIAAGYDQAVHPLQAAFFYIPLEHCEDLATQKRCVELFERLEIHAPPELNERFEGFTLYARRHLDVIARFGRFPHRNALLGRTSTEAERSYMESGGETFAVERAEDDR